MMVVPMPTGLSVGDSAWIELDPAIWQAPAGWQPGEKGFSRIVTGDEPVAVTFTLRGTP